MRNTKIYTAFAGIIFMILVSCTNNKPASSDNAQAKPAIQAPQLNVDSTWAFMEKQMSFGPRVPNSDAHTQCAEYFVRKMKEYGLDVIIQKADLKAFDGTILHSKNIIAQFKPEMKNRIFICSHWDSRPFADHDPETADQKKPVPAANDGASGTAIMMEMARLIKQVKPNIGIDFIFLDAEDYGEPQNMRGTAGEDNWALGSQYWAKHPHKADYYAKFGILLDMVGAKGATFPMEQESMNLASDIVKKVWDKGIQLGYSDYFINQPGGGVTDDHIYINKYLNIPTIDIIHMDVNTGRFFPQWHTTHDDMSQIDKNTLKAVGQTLLEVLYSEQ